MEDHPRRSRLGWALRLGVPLCAWWIAGAGGLFTLSSIRDVLSDESVTSSSALDLTRDVRWTIDNVPGAALERVREGRNGVGWRMDGRRTLRDRTGEEVADFTLWRTLGDGTVERESATTAILATRVRRGWPLLCFEGSTWVAGTSDALHRTMLVFGSAGGVGAGGGVVRIPLGVRPIELMIDGAIAGCALFAILKIPRLVERAVRRWRGLCPRCEYPLHGAAVCPECGLQRRGAGRRVDG